MRKALADLIDSSIIFQYNLPNSNKSIDKTVLSINDDSCFEATNFNDFVSIIYNSILEYSFDGYEMENKDLNNLQYRALRTRVRYNHDATDEAKIKYGFYGEVLLYAIIYKIFNIPKLIARGHFYSVAAKSETAGYDGYHLIEKDDKVQLWFGEVKFYQNYKTAINSALKNIENVVADDYLIDNNLIAIFDKFTMNNSYVVNSKLKELVHKWEENPKINLKQELINNDIKLIYPILIVYEKSAASYDRDIELAVEHIKDKFSSLTFNNITIDYSLFFIFLPIEDVKATKEEVKKWIESQKPLI